METAAHPLFQMRQLVCQPGWGTLCVRSVEKCDDMIVVQYTPVKADDYLAQVLRRFLATGIYYPGAVDHLYVEMVDVNGNVNFYKAYPLFRGTVVVAEEAHGSDFKLSDKEIAAVKFRIRDFLGLTSSQLQYAC